MKFEKVNENKLRITLSMHDLEEKDIDFHDFMSNSIETQELFLDMLEEAEEKIGFQTRNCKIRIEALAMTEDDFVLTITKMMPDKNAKIPRKRPKVKRKTSNISNMSTTNLIYKFNTFDDYCNFIEFIVHNNLLDAQKIAEKISLYLYNGSYYLVLNNLDKQYKNLIRFYTGIIEFGSYVLDPNLFISRLNESGTVVIKHNAFKKSLTHFLK